MPKTTKFEVIKSTGSTVYINGLRVFKDASDGKIRISSDEEITNCPKGSDIERFFKNLLR